MNGRTIAIGDVHGCACALEALLAAISPADADHIITLGDAIDRGPDSRGVIEHLLKLASTCRLTCLLGNHEELMLAVLRNPTQYERWLRFGGAVTLESYGFAGDLSVIPVEHVRFLETWIETLELEGHFFVHANYHEDLPLAEQSGKTLRWKSLSDAFPERHFSGKTAIVGHSAQQSGEILDAGYLKCLDTYCYGGGWLTAMEVDCGTIWQANRRGELRKVC